MGLRWIVMAVVAATLFIGALAPLPATSVLDPELSLVPAVSEDGRVEAPVGARDPVSPPTHRMDPFPPTPAASHVGAPEGLAETRLVDAFTALASQRSLTPGLATRLLREHYRSTGLDAGGDFEGWEANATLSFTYPLGDVNGDGVDDLAMNVYCVDPEPCSAFRYFTTWPPSVSLETQGSDACANPGSAGDARPVFNRLFGIDGATGGMLWQRNESLRPWQYDDAKSLVTHVLDPASGYRPVSNVKPGCPFDYVVGVVPGIDGKGNDLLVHRFQVALGNPYGSTSDPAYVSYDYDEGQTALIHHVIYLVGRADGKIRWTHEADGYYAADGYGHYRGSRYSEGQPPLFYTAAAENLTVNPILQVPLSAGARIAPAVTQAALFLQGVGFVAQYLGTSRSSSFGSATDTPILDAYEPREWSARLNLTSGKVYWRNRDPFPAQADRSLVPVALPRRPVPPNDFFPFGNQSYWGYTPCCFDVSGDGVPDLPYITLEWSTTPMYNTVGPFFLASHLWEFDGATGRPLWSVEIDPSTQRYQREEYTQGRAFEAYFEALGDADGDGGSDVLLHIVYTKETYRHVLSVRKGTTGAELWRLERPRDLYALVLGDSDRDGGNDFAVFEWQDQEFPHRRVYHYLNMTAIPLTVYGGASGARLWNATTETFAAPIDLIAMFSNFKTNGLPDINQDGVGEVPVDDPLYLPDGEVVHRYRYLDGSTGVVRYAFDGVGTFAFIALVGDLNGDAVDDFALLNGDVIDLWVTMYDGATGNAAWSRRVLTPKVADYQSALPYIRFFPMHVPGRDQYGALFNFHLNMGVYNGAGSTYSLYPQIVHYQPNGTIPWSIPDVGPTVLVQGVASGTRAYHHLLDYADEPTGSAKATSRLAEAAPSTLTAFAASMLLAMPISRSILSRRQRP